MRVIQITDADARALLAELAASAYRANTLALRATIDDADVALVERYLADQHDSHVRENRLGAIKKGIAAVLTAPASKLDVGEVHRHFHYVVTRWLQTHGADLRE